MRGMWLYATRDGIDKSHRAISKENGGNIEKGPVGVTSSIQSPTSAIPPSPLFALAI